jgi:hypothetical protein
VEIISHPMAYQPAPSLTIVPSFARSAACTDRGTGQAFEIAHHHRSTAAHRREGRRPRHAQNHVAFYRIVPVSPPHHHPSFIILSHHASSFTLPSSVIWPIPDDEMRSQLLHCTVETISLPVRIVSIQEPCPMETREAPSSSEMSRLNPSASDPAVFDRFGRR